MGRDSAPPRIFWASGDSSEPRLHYAGPQVRVFIFLGNRNLLGFGQFWPSWCLWHLEKFWVRPEITKMEFPGARSCSREKFCQSKSFSLQLRNFFEADTLVRVFLPPPRNCDLLVFGDLSVGSGCCWLRRAGMGSGWEVNKIEKKR